MNQNFHFFTELHKEGINVITKTRIPKLTETSFDGALLWFNRLQEQNLLFHPEDDLTSLFNIKSGLPTFTTTEIEDLQQILQSLENSIGHEQIIDAAYPIFKNAFSLASEA